VTRQRIVDVAGEFIEARQWGIGIYGDTNKAVAETLHEKLAKLYI
jgi:hypothetical protein